MKPIYFLMVPLVTFAAVASVWSLGRRSAVVPAPMSHSRFIAYAQEENRDKMFLLGAGVAFRMLNENPDGYRTGGELMDASWRFWTNALASTNGH